MMRQLALFALSWSVSFLILPSDVAAQSPRTLQGSGTKLSADGSATRARPPRSVGLVPQWRIQLPTSRLSGSAQISFHVSPSRVRKVYEVVDGARRYTYASADAEHQSDIKLRTLAMGGKDVQLEVKSFPVTTIYALGGNGRLIAMDAETGQRRWDVRVGSSGEVYPPSATDDFVAAVSGSTLYMVSAATGKLRSDHRLQSSPAGGPIAVGTSVAVPRHRDAFDVFLFSSEEQYTPKKTMLSFGQLTTTPIVTLNGLAWTTTAGALFVADPETWQSRFQVDCRSRTIGQAAYRNPNQFIVAVEDGYLISVDGSRGREMWEFSTGTTIGSAPYVAGDNVLVAAADGTLFCVDAETGSQRWQIRGMRRVVGQSSGIVVAESATRALAMLDLATGRRVGTLPLGAGETPFANTATDRIYLATAGGTLRCLRPSAARWPTVYRQLEPQRPEDPAGVTGTAEAASDQDSEPASSPTDTDPVDEMAEPADDEDPFGGDDPFGAGDDDEDPFGGDDEDPFGGGDGEDPFGS